MNIYGLKAAIEIVLKKLESLFSDIKNHKYTY